MQRFSRKRIRQCVDRWPQDPEDVIFAASVAVDENPVNAPFPASNLEIDPLHLALLTNAKWAPGRVLRIAFLDGAAAQKAEVKRQAELWLPFIGLKFDWLQGTGPADVRISFRQEGAWSFIGTDCLTIPPDQPTMNFGFLQEGTALHEFGHALGFVHEHQQPAAGVIPWNLPRLYAYYAGAPNYWNKQLVDRNIIQRYAKEQTQFTEWDRGSIMEYPIDAALVTDPKFAVGWNTVLSDVDKSFAANVYPRPIVPPPPPPVRNKTRVIVEYDRGSGVVSVDGREV